MSTGNTIALTRWTFFGKVMSLFFNMLSRLYLGRVKERIRKGKKRGSGVRTVPMEVES